MIERLKAAKTRAQAVSFDFFHWDLWKRREIQNISSLVFKKLLLLKFTHFWLFSLLAFTNLWIWVRIHYLTVLRLHIWCFHPNSCLECCWKMIRNETVYVYMNASMAVKKTKTKKNNKVVPSVSCLAALGHPAGATLVSPEAPPVPWPPAQVSGCRYRWVEGVQGTSCVLQLLLGPPEETWDRWTHADQPWTDWVKLFEKQNTRGTREAIKTVNGRLVSELSC